MEDIEVIIHAAALKRIEVGAYNPLEVKKTNIDGAANVIEAATDAGVDRVVAKTMDEAVDLILETAETMQGGEIAIPTLPAYRLGDLAEAMGAKMNVLGLPSYEKRHESMGPGNSSDTARRMTVAELKEALK